MHEGDRHMTSESDTGRPTDDVGAAFPLTRFLLLEERIAFDGAAVSTGQALVIGRETHAAAESPSEGTDKGQFLGADSRVAGVPDARDGALVDAPLTPESRAPVAPSAIAFVDRDAADYDLLTQAAASRVEVVLLDSARDTAAQMRDALSGRRGFDAIYVVGRVQDGTTHSNDLRLTSAASGPHSAWLGLSLSQSGSLHLVSLDVDQGAVRSDVRLTASQLADLSAASRAFSFDSPPMEAVGAAAADAARLLDKAVSTWGVDGVLSLFRGSDASTEADRVAAASSFLASYRGGEIAVTVHLLPDAALFGARGAFAAVGLDGTPAIYLNAEWATSASREALTWVLTEEFGHFVDWRINAAHDTPGDEGEAFAAALTGAAIEGGTSARIAGESDALNLTLDGVQVEVEMASLLFTQAWNVGTATLEQNSITLGSALHGVSGTTRFLFQSDNPSDALFAGNNTRGRLYAVDGSNNIVHSWYGEMTRLEKSGSTTRGLQFYVYPNAASPSTGTAAQTFLIANPNVGFAYVVGQSYNTSSDPVSPELNKLLTANQAPTATADVATGSMATWTNNTSVPTTTPLTGNVLTNDSDINKTYSVVD